MDPTVVSVEYHLTSEGWTAGSVKVNNKVISHAAIPASRFESWKRIQIAGAEQSRTLWVRTWPFALAGSTSDVAPWAPDASAPLRAVAKAAG